MRSRSAENKEFPFAEKIFLAVNGNLLRLSRCDVELCIRGLSPEPIQRYAVGVGGKNYPVKLVFEAATGLDRLSFTSAAARRNLGQLGFVLVRVGG